MSAHTAHHIAGKEKKGLIKIENFRYTTGNSIDTLRTDLSSGASSGHNALLRCVTACLLVCSTTNCGPQRLLLCFIHTCTTGRDGPASPSTPGWMDQGDRWVPSTPPRGVTSQLTEPLNNWEDGKYVSGEPCAGEDLHREATMEVSTEHLAAASPGSQHRPRQHSPGSSLLGFGPGSSAACSRGSTKSQIYQTHIRAPQLLD